MLVEMPWECFAFQETGAESLRAGRILCKVAVSSGRLCPQRSLGIPPDPTPMYVTGELVTGAAVLRLCQNWKCLLMHLKAGISQCLGNIKES